MIHPLAVDLYSSLPSETRQKTLAQLSQKSMEKSKNHPVYLQVELAKVKSAHQAQQSDRGILA